MGRSIVNVPEENGMMEEKGEYGRASCTLGMRGGEMVFGGRFGPSIEGGCCELPDMMTRRNKATSTNSVMFLAERTVRMYSGCYGSKTGRIGSKTCRIGSCLLSLSVVVIHRCC